MAKKTDLFYGDQGDGVKELQTALNQWQHKGSGNLLIADGIYGDKTKAAVANVMKYYGLDGDGSEIGTDFWDFLINDGSPTKVTTPTNTTNKPNNSTANNTTNNTTNKPFEYEDFNYKDFKYNDYKESDIVNQAYAALQAQLANKPGAYQSQWQSQLDDTINKILNREKFSYDLNGDALYQQYKDKYIQQGKMAMGDAIGQASAMTGGYGNSYAQSVGQQAYQAQLQNLNDIVPELYQMALDKYNNEGQELYNQYAMLGDRENMDYGRYRDSVADWMTERDYLAGRYDSERGFDYSKYTDGRDFAYGKYSDDRNLAYGQYADDKNLAYNEHRNAIEDALKREELDFEKAKWDYTVSENEKDRTESNAKTYHTTSGKVGYDNGSLSDAQIKEMQKALGINADGKWGSGSTSAAGGLTADEAWKAYQNGTLGKKGETVQPKETKNTTDFISRFQTKSEYLARNHNEKQWNEYMEGNIASFLRSGRITDEEAQYLIEYYGLE